MESGGFPAHTCKFRRPCGVRRISSPHIYSEDRERTVWSQEDFQPTHVNSEGRVESGGFPAHTNILEVRITVDRETGCVESGGFPAHTCNVR